MESRLVEAESTRNPEAEAEPSENLLTNECWAPPEREGLLEEADVVDEVESSLGDSYDNDAVAAVVVVVIVLPAVEDNLEVCTELLE